MMTTEPRKVELPASDYGTNKTTLPPARSYQVPGGPYRRSMRDPTVVIKAEIERGGEHDRGYGPRR